MAELFSITRTEGEVLMLHLAGRLDVQTQAALLETAMQAHEAGKRYLLIDLRQVEAITSAGLGALHQVYKMFTPPDELKAWEAQGHNEPYKSPYFKMAGASSHVYYVLNIAGFLQNIPIYPDIDGALTSFPGLTA
jgi:ABC-type transporter Mla MlaB component